MESRTAMQPPPAVALRPLGVAELLDGAVRTVRNNPRTSFTLALPVAVLRASIVAVVSYNVVGNDELAIPQILASVFVSAVFGTLLAGMLAPAYTDELLGHRLSPAQTLRRVGRSGFGLLGLILIVAIAQEVGVVLLVVGGAWLWGIWAVAAPVLSVERVGPRVALSRSFDLVRTQFWRVWGIRSLRWLLTTVLGLFISLPFTLLAAAVTDSDLFATGGAQIGNASLYVTLTALGSVTALTIIGPISAAVDALLYLDLRMRREGMDLVIGLPPASTPPDPAPRQAFTAW